MDFQNNSSASSAAQAQEPGRGGAGNTTVKSLTVVLVAAVFLLVVVFGGLFLAKKAGGSDMSAVKKDQYQAVFLTNGQVYFGKIEEMSNKQIKLSQIYYLQVQQSVQPEEKKDGQAQISLAKLGEELHGPEDTMYIAKDQMLFWENLKDSGKVVQAIKSAGKQ